MGKVGGIALQGSFWGLTPPLLLSFLFYTMTSGLPAYAADGPAACRPTIARVVSVQGPVEVQRSGQAGWSAVIRLDTPLCDGDRLHTGPQSRAALFMQPETLVRVDQNTSVLFGQTAEETLVEFNQEDLVSVSADAHACGAGYFITRFPRKFKVKTPHLNAAVEGTEFLVAMRCESTDLSVFEGKVLATSAGTSVFPSQSVVSGQTLTVGDSEPPAIKLQIKPADAVQWTLYYPPITPAGTVTEEKCINVAPDNRASCLIARAERLLRAGRVDEAQANIADALTTAPDSSDAKALSSIISLVKNDKAEALRLAREAVDSTANSAPAWLALSYAQQADFKLEAALASAKRAADLTPSALALARIAELQLSLGWTREAEKTAKQAVAANTSESRAHMILGFVHLAQIKVEEAREDFGLAIEIDSTDPLSRLGLGLAIIREGKLVEGREQIEIAVALDPTGSLIRSYMGRAYFEERTTARSRLAQEQFNLAEQFDRYDPTPLFYGAVAKQAENRPIEALFDMQESVHLNDNRSVYRPRTALDQDAAARSVGLARQYTELGFEEPARKEVAVALADDPTSFAGQQYLSDIAAFEALQQSTRASAGLQAQLRQPLGADAPLVGLTGSSSLTPGRPYLSVESIGPQRPGLYDFDPLFSGPGVKARAGGLVGEFGTASHELSASTTSERTSVAAGMLHAETDGQRVNNDQSRNAYAALVTLQLMTDLRLQLDFQQTDASFGDLPIRWDPNFVSQNDRNSERFTTSRIGVHGKLSPDSEILFATTYAESSSTLTDDVNPFSLHVGGHSTTVETQYVRSMHHLNVVVGLSSIENPQHILIDIPGCCTFPREGTDREQTGYVYATLALDERFKLIGGAAWDKARLNSIFIDEEHTYPKLGFIFKPAEDTTVRIAYFETMQRPLAAGQTLEPVQVAGFSQMHDDLPGTKSNQTAGAIDQKIGQRVYLGANATNRWMDVPYLGSDSLGNLIGVTARWTESQVGAYIRWLPTSSIALTLQVVDEDFERTQENQGIGGFLSLKQFRVPAMIQWFSPSGFGASLRATYWHQDGIFCAAGSLTCDLTGSATSTITDLGFSYQIPRRAGSISLDVLNIFDKHFQYQSVDTSKLVPFTGRAAFARISLAF